MNADLGRRLLAEFVGTALLVIFGAGALVAALEMGHGQLDYAGLGIVAISFALVIAAVIYMFGTTSGAHINPAVTFSLAVVRRFPWVEVAPYVVVQLAGALVGAVLINAIFGSHASDLSASGGTIVGAGFTKAQAALAEGLGTFLLRGHDHGPGRGPARAGRVRGARHRPRSGVRDHGHRADQRRLGEPGPHLRSLPRDEIFGGSTPWSEFWIYWAGPLAGGALAALAYDLIAQPERPPRPRRRRAPRARSKADACSRRPDQAAPKPTPTTEGRQPHVR